MLSNIDKCTIASKLGFSSLLREMVKGNSALDVSGKSVHILVELYSFTPELTVPHI